MTSKLLLAGTAVVLGGFAVCPLCGVGPDAALGAQLAAVSPAADTAEVTFTIQGMTCGSCALTARIALERVDGVHDAKVSYDSARAVVRFDPARTSPQELVAELERRTGYVARVVADDRRRT